MGHRADLVPLRHRAVRRSGQRRVLLPGVPAAVVVADRVVAAQHRHDVGALLQGWAVVPR